MRNLNARSIALMVAIIFFGILLGGIVYSHLVYFPVYLSALPESSVLVNGPYALHEEKFWFLIHPLAIISLIIALTLNWKIKTRRKLIMISLAVYLVAIIATSLYFVPELRAFHDSPNLALSRAEWFARGQRWQYLSWLRGSLMGLAIVPLLLSLVTNDTSER